MRRVAALAVLLTLGFCVAVSAAGAAHAADDPPLELDKCLAHQEIGAPPPSCTFDNNGHFIGVSSPPGPSSDVDFPPILLIFLAWSAVPVIAAIAVARSRHEPVGLAVLLTLVLGWIGLLIVFYGQRRALGDVDRVVHGSRSTASVSERLGTIEQLHASGVITDEERDRRRTAILDEV